MADSVEHAHHPHEYTAQAKFLTENSKANPTGTRSVSRATYFQSMEESGVTRDVLEAVAAGRKKVLGGAIVVAAHDLEHQIATAKDAGDDINGLKARVTVQTEDGQIRATVAARREISNRIPGSTEPVDPNKPPTFRYGDVSVKIDSDRSIPKDAVSHTRSLIERAMFSDKTEMKHAAE